MGQVVSLFPARPQAEIDSANAMHITHQAARILEQNQADGLLITLTRGNEIIYEGAAGLPSRESSLATSVAQRILFRLGFKQ